MTPGRFALGVGSPSVQTLFVLTPAYQPIGHVYGSGSWRRLTSCGLAASECRSGMLDRRGRSWKVMR